MAVLALGKFGGREIGFASDIELIFVYGGDGKTDGPREVNNAVYFQELVQVYLRTVLARQEGIFHVDLRLRPFGKSGNLACSLEKFEAYYSVAGPAQNFERMALVKVRSVVGEPPLVDPILHGVTDLSTRGNLSITP